MNKINKPFLFNLSSLGYQDYYILFRSGVIYNSKTKRIIEGSKEHRFTLNTKDNKPKQVSLKVLYKQAFNEEYCIDNIFNLPHEQWKQLLTNDTYYVSNYGRVKSYNGYNARILSNVNNGSGYVRVDINGRKELVHLLVAKYFLNNTDIKDKEVHHKNALKIDNYYSNLEYLSCEEHGKKHKEINEYNKQYDFPQEKENNDR